MKRLIAICFSLIITASFSYADYIAPNDNVTSHLNIRQEPNSNSNIIGQLQLGETAELIESVPYYHRVNHQGLIGYVSKSWSVIITSAPGGGSLPSKTDDLIVGSWNIKWLGNRLNDVHNYQRISEIIAKFDVVAIQELRGENFLDRLNKIIAALGDLNLNYAFIYSDETGYLDNPDEGNPTAPKNDYLERYAFMWDTDRIELVEPQQGVRYRFVALPAINNDTFRQVPIYADFKVRNANGFDFRILTTHTVYKSELHYVRRAEIQFINDWMISQVRDSSNPEKNIIAMGDFNANPSGQSAHFNDIVSGTNQYRVLFEEPLIAGEASIRTTIARSASPTPAYLQNPVYDHALVSHETSYAMPSNNLTKAANQLGVVEFDQEPWASEYESHYALEAAMSDHRPIWFKLNYNAQDLD